jgi:hypothetical protein
MTISSETNKVIYTGNGATTVFPYTFKILDDDEILVQTRLTTTGVYTTLVKTTDYTVSGVGAAAGGNVTLVSAASNPTGTKLVLTRSMPKTQTVDLAEFDAFPVDTVEDQLDRAVMIAQEQQEQLDRSIKWDASISGVSATILGTPTALYSLRVNSGATGLEFAAFTSTGSYTFGAGVGLLVQTASLTASVVTLTGTANEITVTNGTGVGTPTFSLPTALTFTGKTVTEGTFASPTISGTATISGKLANTSLRVADTDASHALVITPGSNLTADRILTITTGDAARTLTISGNVTLTTTPITSVVRQIFSATGTYTPTAGMVYCDVTGIGGGGGGGGTALSTAAGSGGGGGGGGVSKIRLTAADIGASKAVTIGSGGTGGVAGNYTGLAGGDTSLGSLMVAKGGSPGTGGAGNAGGIGGDGGVAGTGTITATGSGGSTGFGATITTVSLIAGHGGSGLYGGRPRSQAVSLASGGDTGLAGTDFGSGGNGGGSANSSAATAGGDGKAGFIEVIEYIAA